MMVAACMSSPVSAALARYPCSVASVAVKAGRYLLPMTEGILGKAVAAADFAEIADVGTYKHKLLVAGVNLHCV